jgi:hypothetical protein
MPARISVDARLQINDATQDKHCEVSGDGDVSEETGA